MTHLKIEQNNSAIEQVSSAVITKLYELAISGELDQDSNLVGRLHTDATYQEYIDALTTAYPDLYITATNIYLSFADPGVTRILSSQFSGDGIGITQSELYSITSLRDAFRNNTTIQYFDDLDKLSGVGILSPYEFQGCTNLKSIDLSRITRIEVDGGMQEQYTFEGCSSLTQIIAPQLQNISWYMCRNCTNLKIFIGKNVTTPGRLTWVFGGCPALKAIIMPKLGNGFAFTGDFYHENGLFGGDSNNITLVEVSDIDYINKWGTSRYSTGIRALVIHGDTIPTLNEWSSGDNFTDYFANASMKIYVKDSLLSTYQSDTTWSEYYSAHIKGISEYNPADYLDSNLLQIYNEAMSTSYTAS